MITGCCAASIVVPAHVLYWQVSDRLRSIGIGRNRMLPSDIGQRSHIEQRSNTLGKVHGVAYLTFPHLDDAPSK